MKLLPGNGWSINDAGEAPGVSYQDPATGTTYIPSCTLAINNVGMAAGEFGTAAELHACVWDYKTHKATDLHALLPLATYSSAKAISDSGYVVGWFRNPPFLPNEQGFIVDLNKGEAYLLGDLRGGLSYAGAVSVNNFGQVVGHSGVTDTVGHAFLWDIATKTIRDLGDLPGGIDSSHAYDINDSGLVVGWSHGARTPYQPYTSAASGQGFLWAADSGMRNLNDLIDPADPLKPYVEIIEARGINNRGQISASGVDRRTLQIHAFLMTPIP